MHQQRILLVDDDHSVARRLQAEPYMERFRVGSARSVSEALERLREEPKPDALILDICLEEGAGDEVPGLPDDGLGLLQWIRKGSDVPILMLSATRSECVRVLALNLGADDYVTKPFSPEELAARIRAVLRRGRGRSEDSGELRFGPLAIDRERLTVTKNGVPVRLTLMEFRVLDTLAAASGRVLARSQILDAICGPGHFTVERTVDVHVRRLREKLEDDPSAPRIVLTVRGLGYRFGLYPTPRRGGTATVTYA